ncbi:MAG: ABC transporter substrate-binding protein [Thaumarchaeota archaeon]|nr:ABC transporter substrate-binding protein [Nitrososphaerota archaeon]
MQFLPKKREGIARTLAAGIVIVVIVIGAVAAIYLTTLKNNSSTTSTTHNTLTIDDVFWPGPADENQLSAIGEVPYPNWLTYTVYQPLVTLNASALYNQGVIQYLPALANNWTASTDGRTYTFNLRQGVKFSDGNPLNAYDVWAQMYGFYYLSGNSSGSFFESYNVFNFTNVNFGPSSLALLNQSGLVNPSAAAVSMMSNPNWPIYAPSSSQIVFHLQAPFNYFLGTLVVYVGLIFDSQFVLDHGGFGAPGSENTYFNQNTIPGTGPYVVSSFSENSFIKFTQNPSYWGDSLTAAQVKGNPYLDPGHAANVIVNAKSDDITRYNDLQSGQAQIAGILSQNYALVLQNSKYSEFNFPSKAAVFVGLAMNTQRSPTNITAVRQAIVHAINYTDISDKVFFGGLSPMVGPEYPIFSQFYDLGNLPPYSFNVTESEQILSAAGITASTLQPITLTVASSCSYCADTAAIVKNDLAVIGLTVNIDSVPPSQYGCPITAGTCSYTTALANASQVAQMEWYGTGTFAPAALTPADNWLLSVSNDTSSNNWAIYSNPTVQACINAWTQTSNTTLLTDLCTKAQAQVYNDAPYIWLGTIKPLFGAGSIVWDNTVVKSFYVDPVFSGQSSTVIFNTVQFAG